MQKEEREISYTLVARVFAARARAREIEGTAWRNSLQPSQPQAAAMASTKVQRIMTQPINLIFRYLQSKARIQIWLFEQKDLRIEGRIIGFDEYMNLVLDDAEEVNIKKNSRKQLGRILLKGDNITLMMNTGKWCWGTGNFFLCFLFYLFIFCLIWVFRFVVFQLRIVRVYAEFMGSVCGNYW